MTFSWEPWLFEVRARLFPESGALSPERWDEADLPGDLRVQLPRQLASSKWLGSLYAGMKALAPVEHIDRRERDRGRAIVVGRVLAGATEVTFAIDTLDDDELYDDVVEEVDRYFKMQYAADGYDDSCVVPGGFPTAGDGIYRCLGRLRALRGEQRFDFDVHARFGLEFRADLRRRAVELLRRYDGLAACAGLETKRYYHYLHELARSRLCLDLPGNGAFCFRLVEYLAVGSCVIAYPHANRLPEPLRDGEEVVYVRPDLSDLTEKCAYYASHDSERERMARNAARYFDRHLHRESLAAYYLRTCLDAGQDEPHGRPVSRHARGRQGR